MRTSRPGLTLALIALLAAAVAIIADSTPTIFAQDELTSGETIEGVISDKDGDTYAISATMGQLIMISMVSDEINSLLFISDADDTRLAYDDDSGGNNNARLVYLVQADGTFTITAKSVGSGTGVYTLTPLVTALPIVEFGSTVTLTPGAEDELVYAAFDSSSRGTVVDVWASTQGEDDVTVELIGVDAQPIEFDDDDGPFDNSLLRRVVLSGDGLYLVKVGTSRSDTPFTAPIDVMVEATEELFITDAPQKVMLTGHDLGTEVFTFEATAGIVYRITAIAEMGSGVEMTLFDTDARVDPDLKTSSALKITWEWLSGTDGLVRLDVHPNLFRNDGDYLSIMLETME